MEIKMKGKLGIIATFLVFLVGLFSVNTSGAVENNFNITILSEEHDLTNHMAIFEIQNFDSSTKRDFNVQILISNTSFSIDDLTDLWIYEWKPLNQSFHNYSYYIETIYYEYPDNMSEYWLCWNDTSNMTHYPCNIIKREDNPYWAMNLDWKPAKMALVHQSEKVSADYGNINIPKYGSECEQDDFGNEYDCNGTKRFKITWRTPIGEVAGMWGSSGYYSINDANTGFSYDPWWHASWPKKTPINVSVASGTTRQEYQVVANVTYDSDMQADFDDLRFVNASDDTELDYWIEENVSSVNAYTWVEVDANITTTNMTIYMYYGNAGASTTSNGTATFDQFADDQTITTQGTNYYPDNTVSFNRSTHAVVSRTKSNNTNSANGQTTRHLIEASHSVNPYTAPESTFYTGGGCCGGNISFGALTSYSMPSNTFYRFEIIPNGSNTKGIINRSDEAIDGTPTTSFYLAFRVDSGLAVHADLTIDYGLVRKWHDPEPTVVFGTEETSNTAPNVSLNFPGNATWNLSTEIFFGFTPTDDAGYLNCSLWITNSTNGNFTYNRSNESAIMNGTVNVISQNLTDGNYTWNTECCDNGTTPLCNESENNWTLYVDTTAPTDNSPADQNHFLDEPRRMGWILQDNVRAGNYTVFRDGVIQNSSTAWTNNTNLNIWIDTRTLGTFNYSVNFTDYAGWTGQDDVSVNITRYVEGGLGGEVPDYIPCANYTLMGDLRFGYLNVSAPPGGFTPVKTIRILNGEETNQSYSVNFTNETIEMCEFMAYNNEPVEPLSYREYVFRCVARNGTVRGNIMITANGCTDAYDLTISPITNVLEWFAYVWDMGLTGFIYTLNTPFEIYGFVFPAWLIILIIIFVIILFIWGMLL